MHSESKLNPANKSSINQGFRARRFAFFMSLLNSVKKEDGPVKILDIGGTQSYWENMWPGAVNEAAINVTMLNLFEEETKYPNFKSIVGNACDLSWVEDNAFDIVYSNSVIEHLYTIENQQKMANEVMRVGKCYFVQTPYYYFPVEPHWLFPFFQFLPFGVKFFLTNNFTLGHYVREPNREKALDRVKEVKLLTKKEMQFLFAGGKMYKETFLGLTKSIVMYRF
jgi:hypothetical protein